MLQLCSNLAVYGFGKQFAGDSAVKYHYHKGVGSRQHGTLRENGQPVHSWDAEDLLMEALDREGKMTVCKVVQVVCENVAFV